MPRLSPARSTLALLLGVFLIALGSLASPAQAADDPLLAPPGRCANDTTYGGNQYHEAMECLINYARSASGIRPVSFCPSPCGGYASDVGKLHYSAFSKVTDVKKCPRPLPNYGHNACGRAMNYWIDYLRYPYRSWAEIITFGSQWTARKAMNWWLTSNGHRRVILDPGYNEAGVAVQAGTTPEYGAGSMVWVAHFATHA